MSLPCQSHCSHPRVNAVSYLQSKGGERPFRLPRFSSGSARTGRDRCVRCTHGMAVNTFLLLSSLLLMKAELLVQIRPWAWMGSKTSEPGFLVLQARRVRCKQVPFLQDYNQAPTSYLNSFGNRSVHRVTLNSSLSSSRCPPGIVLATELELSKPVWMDVAISTQFPAVAQGLGLVSRHDTCCNFHQPCPLPF